MGVMRNDTLETLSNQLADAVAAAAASVVQVQGRRRPASGVVIAADTVLTTGRAIGGGEHLRVRTPGGETHDAQLAGWDPVTHLAVLRADGLNGSPAAAAADTPARVGHLAIAVARSWSNAVTASMGNIAVIGGPLPTGRRHSIEEVIRTTAPMHQGFAGGALVNTAGRIIGITTALEIRGLGVAIPSAIAFKAAQDIVEHGQLKRGYLGLAGQRVQLAAAQRGAAAADSAMLVVGLTSGSPAETAGLLVGDALTHFDGVAIDTPDRLLELLAGDRVGRTVTMRVVRGGAPVELTVTIGERRPRGSDPGA
jgi:S1-C subfamily serine protease